MMVGGGYTVQRNKREKKMGQKNIPTEGALWRLRHPQLLSWAGSAWHTRGGGLGLEWESVGWGLLQQSLGAEPEEGGRGSNQLRLWGRIASPVDRADLLSPVFSPPSV